MKIPEDRVILTIARAEGVWHVEEGGTPFGHSRERNVAEAAARRRAREIQDAGRLCVVRLLGETSWAAT